MSSECHQSVLRVSSECHQSFLSFFNWFIDWNWFDNHPHVLRVPLAHLVCQFLAFFVRVCVCLFLRLALTPLTATRMVPSYPQISSTSAFQTFPKLPSPNTWQSFTSIDEQYFLDYLFAWWKETEMIGWYMMISFFVCCGFLDEHYGWT